MFTTRILGVSRYKQKQPDDTWVEAGNRYDVMHEDPERKVTGFTTDRPTISDIALAGMNPQPAVNDEWTFHYTKHGKMILGDKVTEKK